MKSQRAQWIFCFLVGLGVSVAMGAPTILNNMIRLHVQSDASFPAAGPDTLGGLLFGNTTGEPYWSPGDGGSWQSLASGWNTNGTTTTTTQNVTASAGVITQSSGFMKASGYADVADGKAFRFSGSQANIQAADSFAMLSCDGATRVCTVGQSIASPLYTSSASSGTNAFAVATNGARIDFGAGASDYASSDGTTVSFASYLSADSVNAVSGTVSSSATTSPLLLSASMNAATASTTTAAICANPGSGLDADDLLFSVAAGGCVANKKFTVDNEGDVLTAGSFGLGSKMHWSATQPTIVSGGCTTPSISSGGDSASFNITIGTSCAGVTDVVVGLPTSARYWNCWATTSAPDTRVVDQVQTGSATQATFRSYSRTTGAPLDWTASQTVQASCVAGGF